MDEGIASKSVSLTTLINFLILNINLISNLRFWYRLLDNEIKNLYVSNVHQVCF